LTYYTSKVALQAIDYEHGIRKV